MHTTGRARDGKVARWAAAVAVSALVLGACSDDDGGGTESDDFGTGSETEAVTDRGTEVEPPATAGEGAPDAEGGGVVDRTDGGSSGAEGATETEGGVVGTTEG